VFPLARRWAPTALAALFGASGVLHLVRPDLYGALIPRVLPAPGAIIAVSGIAELVCAVGLVSGRRWAGPASALLLLAVWPGNISFALDAAGDPTATQPMIALAWLRLPLQIPLIWAALQAR
jgi:uncharacterized membrane protein